MSLKNTAGSYGIIAKGFHWLSALIVLGLLPLGFYMVALEFSAFKLSLYWWHKSFGTLLLFLVMLRMLWRFTNVSPPAHPDHHRWEQRLAGFIHVVLYISMVGMTISGWVMSSAGDFTHSFFGLFDMPRIVAKDEQFFRLSRGRDREQCV